MKLLLGMGCSYIDYIDVFAVELFKHLVKCVHTWQTHHIAVVMPEKYGIAIQQGSMAGSSTFTLKSFKWGSLVSAII